MRCAAGPVFSYMKRPVSVTRPTYSASAICGVSATSSARMRSHTISAVHDASATTWLIVPKCVLSWWWSRLRIGASPISIGVAVEVAAVQEDDRALGDVVGHVGDQLVAELEERVLVGQRELAGCR